MPETFFEVSSAASVKRALTAARHFGFSPVESIIGDPEKQIREFGVRAIRELPRSFAPLTVEAAAALNYYSSLPRVETPNPLLLYHLKTDRDATRLYLDIVGNGKSVAEALIMKASLAILDELGVKNISIRINSVGDRDSAARYARELQGYLRKNLNDLPAGSRQLVRDDCFNCLGQLREKGHAVCAGAPRSIDYLSEPSRRHLSEILEFLESMNVSYQLDTSLVSARDTATHTIFEILYGGESSALIARGGRYDEISRKLLRVPIPAIGAVFSFHAPANSVSSAPAPTRAPRRAKIFFIYVGPEAKRKSLTVLEMLRESRIPLEQSLGRDKFSAQLMAAEKLRVPWTIIMGHKEALEGTVIVRHMETRSQEIIPLPQLSVYLKKEVL